MSLVISVSGLNVSHYEQLLLFIILMPFSEYNEVDETTRHRNNIANNDLFLHC